MDAGPSATQGILQYAVNTRKSRISNSISNNSAARGSTCHTACDTPTFLGGQSYSPRRRSADEQGISTNHLQSTLNKPLTSQEFVNDFNRMSSGSAECQTTDCWCSGWWKGKDNEDTEYGFQQISGFVRHPILIRGPFVDGANYCCSTNRITASTTAHMWLAKVYQKRIQTAEKRAKQQQNYVVVERCFQCIAVISSTEWGLLVLRQTSEQQNTNRQNTQSTYE